MTIKTSDRVLDIHDGLCNARILLARYAGKLKALECDLDNLRQDLADLDDWFIDAIINCKDEEENETDL